MPNSIIRRVKRTALAAAIATVAACAGDAPTAPDATGTYALSRINGAALPAPLPSDSPDQSVMATGGTLVVRGDRSWQAEVGATVFTGGFSLPANNVRTGTWTLSRDTVYFRDARDGSVIPAVLAAGRITATLEDVAFEFERK